MSVSHISVALRRRIRERSRGLCEYCLISEKDTFFPHEPDHIIAEKHGGETVSENLALACWHGVLDTGFNSLRRQGTTRL